MSGESSVAGLAVTSAAVAGVAVVLALALRPLVRRRYGDDPYRRYWSAKIVTYVITGLTVVVLIALWAPLGGRLSLIVGFATAGVAFAMQEVIGALFGWINVLAGRIYTVGDRIEMAGVRGDVVDITPLRTTLFEIGGETRAVADATWVAARQPTGRIVTVSNKKTFTEPVFNFSAHLEWIWDEVVFAVDQRTDWMRAEAIVLEAMRDDDPQARRKGEEALARLGERYLLSRAEVAPQTFVRVADGGIEIVGRFVTAVRQSRSAKDRVARRVLERFAAEGLRVAYPTYSVAVDTHSGPQGGGAEADRSGGRPDGGDASRSLP